MSLQPIRRSFLVQDSQLQHGQLVAAFDIGGTNFRMAIAEQIAGPTSDSPAQLLVSSAAEEKTQRVANPTATIYELLAPHLDSLHAIVVAIARPIVDNRCLAGGNIPWPFDAREIVRLAHRPCKLMNDFTAIGWAVANGIETDEAVVLQCGEPYSPGNMAVLGPGTGLGMVAVPYFEESGRHLVLPSEGGHTPLGMRADRLQRNLRTWLQKHKGTTIYDQLVSGRGLALLLYFLFKSDARIHRSAVDKELREQLTEEENNSDKLPSLITSKALDESSPACMVALQLWMGLLGEAARNLAMSCLPKQGLYIGGGILPRLLEQTNFLTQYGGYFAKGFLDTPLETDRALLRTIPVKVCRRCDLGLQGALAYAAQMPAATCNINGATHKKHYTV